jgi:hypothetical protein
LYFHATALAQGGGNLGLDLGLLTGPSSLVSANTTRLDSWWIEKRWLDDRIAIRVGQFAGQDFYGNAQYGEAFINGPMGYALGNLSTTFETANPFATPAAEIRIVPIDNIYLKSMVMAGDPSPLTSNPTGLVPTFRGNPVVVSEIGFTPGRNATSGTVDDVASRKGYSGLYQFGAAYNPGDFTTPLSPTPVSGNYLSLVLEGEPGSLARRPERSARPGCDVCDRLESARCQPQLHAAHGGAAFQRAAASGFSQLHIAGLCAKQSELRVPPTRNGCLEDRTRR